MNDFKIGDDPERLARPHWTVALKAENVKLNQENEQFRQMVYGLGYKLNKLLSNATFPADGAGRGCNVQGAYGLGYKHGAHAALQEIELRLREVQLTANDD